MGRKKGEILTPFHTRGKSVKEIFGRCDEGEGGKGVGKIGGSHCRGLQD